MAKTAAALHILVKEEKLALDLLEQIKNGADFGKLAKKHSICPSGKRGGDLGEFRQGQKVPAFDKVVFSCPVLSRPARCTPSSDITSLRCCTATNSKAFSRRRP